MNLKIEDKNVPLPKAFIKLGKSEHMKKYLENGELRFSPAKLFSEMQEGNDKIADRYEGSLRYPVECVVAAPITSTDENGMPVYGKGFMIADKADFSITFNKIQRIPFHCLYCYDKPVMNALIRLDNYNQMAEEFPDYDTAVIIYNTHEFIKRIKENFVIYCNHIKYTDITLSESEIENPIHFLFYKRKMYKQQKEFRIALPKLMIEEPQNYQIGSITDIAYCVRLKDLEKGIIVAENDDILEKIKKNHEKRCYYNSDLLRKREKLSEIL